jgi:hydroxymethylglutaryl-CoA lyase
MAEAAQDRKLPATARKIELIDALSQTGLRHLQIVSFVNPKAVPGMADADDQLLCLRSREQNAEE